MVHFWFWNNLSQAIHSRHVLAFHLQSTLSENILIRSSITWFCQHGMYFCSHFYLILLILLMRCHHCIPNVAGKNCGMEFEIVTSPTTIDMEMWVVTIFSHFVCLTIFHSNPSHRIFKIHNKALFRRTIIISTENLQHTLSPVTRAAHRAFHRLRWNITMTGIIIGTRCHCLSTPKTANATRFTENQLPSLWQTINCYKSHFFRSIHYS